MTEFYSPFKRVTTVSGLLTGIVSHQQGPKNFPVPDWFIHFNMVIPGPGKWQVENHLNKVTLVSR